MLMYPLYLYIITIQLTVINNRVKNQSKKNTVIKLPVYNRGLGAKLL